MPEYPTLATPSVPRMGEAYVEWAKANHPEPEIWPMEDILKLGTVWPDETNSRLTVAQVIPDIQAQILAHYQMYDILILSMREHGQAVPVRITNDRLRLRDGIHRVTIAHSLGWESMKVSTSYSAWLDWDKSEEGIKYHTMWIQRLKDAGAVSELAT